MTDWTGTKNVNNNNYTGLAVFSSATSTVSWNAVTRKFTITLPSIARASTTVDFVFAQMKSDILVGGSNVPLNFGFNPFTNNSSALYSNWSFQDSHEILGGVPTRDNTITYSSAPYMVAGLNKDSTGLIFTSTYVAQLNSLEGLYLRIYSSSTNNYASPSLDRDSGNLTTLAPTSILARIPISAATYDDVNEVISYQDPGAQVFSTYIESKFLESLNLSLTDDKSRPISEVASGESKVGTISYKFTLKWEVEHGA